MTALNKPSFKVRLGFTLIEVLIGIGVFTVVCLGAATALGSITKLQRDSLEKSKACNLAALIGQWRGMHMASLAYSYYAGQFIPTALNPTPSKLIIGTAGTNLKPEDVWKGSASTSAKWMAECPFLKAGTVAATSFRKYPSTVPEAITVPYYIVDLNAPGYTTATAEFPTGSQFESYRDLLITITPPSTSWTISGKAVRTKWAVMTIWSAPRDYLDGSTSVSGYAKIPTRFLARFLVPDAFCP